MTLPPLGTRSCFWDHDFFHYNSVLHSAAVGGSVVGDVGFL